VCSCWPVPYAAPACSHSGCVDYVLAACHIVCTSVAHPSQCVTSITFLILMKWLHIHVLQKLRRHKHDLWLSSSHLDTWHRRLCDWLHAHLAQLSASRSSRRDSARAVYWTRLHPHCFLHPLHFGAAMFMWVEVTWLSIVEYLTVDMSLGDIPNAPHLLPLTPEW